MVEGRVAAAEAALVEVECDLGAALCAVVDREGCCDDRYAHLVPGESRLPTRRELERRLHVADELLRIERPPLRDVLARYRDVVWEASGAVGRRAEATRELQHALLAVVATYEAAHALFHALAEELSSDARERGLDPDVRRAFLDP